MSKVFSIYINISRISVSDSFSYQWRIFVKVSGVFLCDGVRERVGREGGRVEERLRDWREGEAKRRRVGREVGRDRRE